MPASVYAGPVRYVRYSHNFVYAASLTADADVAASTHPGTRGTIRRRATTIVMFCGDWSHPKSSTARNLCRSQDSMRRSARARRAMMSCTRATF